VGSLADAPIAYATISLKKIDQHCCMHLDFVHVFCDYTGSQGIRLLLYGIKETYEDGLIIDSTLLADLQHLMQSFLNDNGLFNIVVLNKTNRTTRQFTDLVNDTNLCYWFRPTGLGFGQQLLPKPYMDFVWYLSLSDDANG